MDTSTDSGSLLAELAKLTDRLTKIETALAALAGRHDAAPQSAAPGPVVNTPYLTAPEAAAYLRTTVQGVYSLVKRRKIKPAPGSSKLRFTRSELDGYLARRR